jgi:hypothetical protein
VDNTVGSRQKNVCEGNDAQSRIADCRLKQVEDYTVASRCVDVSGARP